MCYHQILTTIKNDLKIKSIFPVVSLALRKHKGEQAMILKNLNTRDFHSVLSASGAGNKN